MAETTLPRFTDDEYEDDALQRAAERRRRFTAIIDLYLVLTVGILVSTGLMMVWSTTFYWSEPQSALFMQQLRNAAIGSVIMIIMGVIDYRVWRRLATPLMGGVILALIGVLLMPPLFGARRAYFEGAVQPSEAAMLAVIIYMAAWLSSKQTKIRYLTYGLLPFALLVGTIAGLIVLQPDLSTAALIFVTAAIMFFLAGADWVQIGITALVFAGLSFIAVTQIDYANTRWQSFIDMLRDPIQANASHAQAVIIAFLNGGLGGVGLGQSYQKFFNLPAAHTDSIFAVIGEELGLFGCALVIGLYVMLMIRGFRIARNAPDIFGSLLASGVTVALVIEAMFNVAVMAAVVPFVGVPLPFISFGGSSLVAAMAGVGLLVSVSRATLKRSQPTRKTNETLNLPGVRGSISRVRQRPVE